MEWISVKDRLPESVAESYLIINRAKWKKGVKPKRDISKSQFISIGWFISGKLEEANPPINPDKDIERIITHWMPLPKMPKF